MIGTHALTPVCVWYNYSCVFVTPTVSLGPFILSLEVQENPKQVLRANTLAYWDVVRQAVLTRATMYCRKYTRVLAGWPCLRAQGLKQVPDSLPPACVWGSLIQCRFRFLYFCPFLFNKNLLANFFKIIYFVFQLKSVPDPID